MFSGKIKMKIPKYLYIKKSWKSEKKKCSVPTLYGKRMWTENTCKEEINRKKERKES